MGAKTTHLVDYWFKLDVDGLAEHLEAEHDMSRLEAWSEALLWFRAKVLEMEERHLQQAASGKRRGRKPKAPPGETPPAEQKH